MNFHIPTELTNKAEIFKYLKDNKALISLQKRRSDKRADSVNLHIPFVNTAIDYQSKDAASTNDDAPTGSITIKAVGNTTNVLDSHCDVHIPGLWKKTLQENKYILHLQEHESEFDKVISDNTMVSTKTLSFKSLGIDYEGSTQALILESIAPLDRNPYMCEQYKKGYVKNHSVGMRYVQMEMCINSEEKYYMDEKANWEKYYPMIANKSAADEKGYFWAVTEAKLIEISAVVIGSNRITPTQSVTENTEAAKGTSLSIEPSNDTQKIKINYSQIKFL